MATNQLGFREREFQVPKPAGVYRVMVLGDSLTWGAGLAEAQRYTNRLEELLRETHAGRQIEVLNFGVSGGPTVRERDLLAEHVDAVDPDLVVVGFCLNDTQQKSQRYSIEGEKYRLLFSGIHRLRYVGLHRSATFLGGRLANFLAATGLTPTWQDALQRTYEPDSTQWKEFVAALEDIKSTCDRRGLPTPIFAVLNQGVSADRPTDYDNPDVELKTYLAWYHQVEAAAAEAGMVTVNFEREFARELAEEPLGVNRLDVHPSARCNEICARKLAKLVAPLLDAPAARVGRRP